MKKLLVFLLCALLLWGCGKTEAEPEVTEPATEPSSAPAPQVELEPLCDGKTLKVLAIGNSFTNNATEYLFDIAVAEGFTDVTVGRLFIGSCTLQMHADNAANDAPKYIYYKTTTGLWDKTENATLLQGLQDEQWDIIVLHQNSGRSGQPETFDGHLERLVDYVNQNKTNPDALLVWHMAWAYQSDSTQSVFAEYGKNQQVMYDAITSVAQQKILPNDAFCALIPAGTAIQNARTSSFGDTLTSDGYHLNKMGKVIAAYTWYAIFAGKTLDKISLTHVSGLGLSDGDKAIIQESVNNALANPYMVTASVHK